MWLAVISNYDNVNQNCYSLKTALLLENINWAQIQNITGRIIKKWWLLLEPAIFQFIIDRDKFICNFLFRAKQSVAYTEA